MVHVYDANTPQIFQFACKCALMTCQSTNMCGAIRVCSPQSALESHRCSQNFFEGGRAEKSKGVPVKNGKGPKKLACKKLTAR